jgi:transcription termination factor NusB
MRKKKNLKGDLNTFLNNISTNVLNFGFSLSRWDRLKPNGKLFTSFIEFCVNESNLNLQLNINNYKKIIESFGNLHLQKEVVNCVNIYTKLIKEELTKPLEMNEIVELNEIYTRDSLVSFNQSILGKIINNYRLFIFS